MYLLHISDPHFSTDKYQVEQYQILDGLTELINNKEKKEDFFIVLTGDITYGGQEKGFKEASDFFTELFKNVSINSKNFILCPGNHDYDKCDKNEPFKNFNTFSYSLRKDNEFSFDTLNSNRIYIKDSICFLSINTTYHAEHNYGKIDVDNLLKLLNTKSQEIEESKIRIILCHHHILNLLDKDDSAIKNSYQLFEILKKYNFHFLFHGHQHAKQLFNINGIHVNSISSLLETRTVSNLIAYYDIKDENNFIKEEYIFLKDESNSQGKQGSYRKL